MFFYIPLLLDTLVLSLSFVFRNGKISFLFGNRAITGALTSCTSVRLTYGDQIFFWQTGMFGYNTNCETSSNNMDKYKYEYKPEDGMA